MILPHTDTSIILLLLLSALCWGLWPTFLKLAKRYRFELFYFDFGLGLALFAFICAFTFGSLGFDGFTFRDDLMNARKQEWLYAFLAAMIFNFGNMLMLAAVSVAGMALAFPLAFGSALVVSSWMDYFSHPATSIMALLCGTGLIVASLIFNGVGFSHLKLLQYEHLARSGKTKSTRRPVAIKPIILAIVGGLVMGTFAPLLLRAQDPDEGVGPYGLLFIFAGAVVISTFIYNLFFMNLPVEGEPLEMGDYLQATVRQHALGFLSGIVWGLGAIAAFVSLTPKGDTHLAPPLGSILGQAAPVVAALWGLFVSKEVKAGDTKVKAINAVTLVLFVCGVILICFAPVWVAKQ